MKIEIYNEYSPHSEYLKTQGKDFLTGIREYWGEWAEISFQIHRDIFDNPVGTKIIIEFDDMSKFGDIKCVYDSKSGWTSQSTGMIKTLMQYAKESLSMIQYNNEDYSQIGYIVSSVYSPQEMECSNRIPVDTVVTHWAIKGQQLVECDTQTPFYTRIYHNRHNGLKCVKTGIQGEWLKNTRLLHPTPIYFPNPNESSDKMTDMSKL